MFNRQSHTLVNGFRKAENCCVDACTQKHKRTQFLIPPFYFNTHIMVYTLISVVVFPEIMRNNVSNTIEKK